MTVLVSDRKTKEQTQVTWNLTVLSENQIKSVWIDCNVSRKAGEVWDMLQGYRWKKADRLWNQIKGAGGYGTDTIEGMRSVSRGDTALNREDFFVEIDSIMGEIFSKAVVKYDRTKGSFIGFLSFLSKEVIAVFWREQALTSHHDEDAYMIGACEQNEQITDFMVSLSHREAEVIGLLTAGYGWTLTSSDRYESYFMGVRPFYEQYIKDELDISRDKFYDLWADLKYKFGSLKLETSSGYVIEADFAEAM